MERLRDHTWLTAGLVAAAGAALTLSACTAGNSGSDARRTAYQRVIEDPHPRPADVIEAAGAPDDVARADDGSLLLTYDAGNVEDDEGPAASAWRIVGPDGRTVAEHAEHTDAEAAPAAFRGVRGGFVRVPSGEGSEGVYALDTHGKRHKVTTAETPLRTRPGDIALSAWEPSLVYRPATRTMAPPAGLPDSAHGFTVDERGTAWSLDQPLGGKDAGRVVRQRDGHGLGSRAIPKPYAGETLTARGGVGALALTRHGTVRGLWVTTDRGARWRTLLGGGIPWRGLKADPESLVLETLADGRLLVGDGDGRFWLAEDRANRGFHELKTPAEFTSFAVEGTTLYGIADATTASYGLVKGEGLWVSRDSGRNWRHAQPSAS